MCLCSEQQDDKCVCLMAFHFPLLQRKLKYSSCCYITKPQSFIVSWRYVNKTTCFATYMQLYASWAEEIACSTLKRLNVSPCNYSRLQQSKRTASKPQILSIKRRPNSLSSVLQHDHIIDANGGSN